jgi:hypothetical protein
MQAFVHERLQHSAGASSSVQELHAAYRVWCAEHGHEVLSLPKFGGALTALGYTKWKSCGLMRYPDLQLVA